MNAATARDHLGHASDQLNAANACLDFLEGELSQPLLIGLTVAIRTCMAAVAEDLAAVDKALDGEARP